ncbi:hypothetical protein ACJX0J_041072, partial [Zea mays]
GLHHYMRSDSFLINLQFSKNERACRFTLSVIIGAHTLFFSFEKFSYNNLTTFKPHAMSPTKTKTDT